MICLVDCGPRYGAHWLTSLCIRVYEIFQEFGAVKPGQLSSVLGGEHMRTDGVDEPEVALRLRATTKTRDGIV